jgi:methionyl-tRNA formyltransferase
LHDKLAAVGADLIVETLKKLETGEAVRIPQDDELSCYAPMLTKNMGNLDFTKSSTELWRLIRGLQPWPCADTVINGKKVKIYEAVPEKASGECGKVIEVTKKSFTIACGEGSLRILKLQPEGKKLMDAAAFLAGNKIETGMIL